MKHEHHESNEHHETYKTRSIEEIIRVGKQLLEDDEIAFIDEVRLGRWVMASDRGIYGVYDSKHQAIEDTISGHSQTRDKCKKDPVMSLIREINLEAKNCGMEPFVSKTFHYRKRLGTGRGMGTKVVNRSLEEAGVCDFYVHALNTGKYGFYYLENLIQH